LARAYFTAAGVNLGGSNVLSGPQQGGGAFQGPQGKCLFWNDRTGVLLVRATLQDLQIIEEAVQALNETPDQVTIECRFVEIGQDDSRALGFDWFMGNFRMGPNGGVGVSGGTQPSYSGRPSGSNPFGVFPGTFGVPSQTPNAASDQLITGGLRNSTAGSSAVPTLATVTGILTDPQFRVAIKALEQRSGVDILSAPKVTTVSGRQAQIQVIDLQTIVTYNQSGAAGGGTTTGVTGGTTGR